MFTNIISNPTKIGFPYNYAEFLCDTVSDIKTLPTNQRSFNNEKNCAIGSKALVLSTKDLYILDNSSKWAYLKNIESSNNSGTTGTVASDIANVSEFTSYIGI